VKPKHVSVVYKQIHISIALNSERKAYGNLASQSTKGCGNHNHGPRTGVTPFGENHPQVISLDEKGQEGKD